MELSDLDLTALVQACPCPMFIARNDGELILYNGHLSDLVGLKPVLVTDLLASESSPAARMLVNAEAAPAEPLKISIALPDGRPGIMTLRAVVNSDVVVGQLWLQDDPSVSQAEKLEGVVQMARALGHELNQPLTVIMGQAEILLMRLGDGGDVSNRLTTIISEVERLEELTRKLSRIVRYRTQTYADGTHYLDLDKSTD